MRTARDDGSAAGSSTPRPAAPTVDQVDQIAPTTTLVVPESFIDANGHMNVVEYFSIAAHQIGGVYERVGLGHDYRSRRRMSLFTVDHRLRYYSEVCLGETLSAHVLLHDRSRRSLHAVCYLVNRDQGRLACLMEAAFVHVSLHDRRSVPYPPDIAAALDRAIAEQPALPWRRPEPSDLPEAAPR